MHNSMTCSCNAADSAWQQMHNMWSSHYRLLFQKQGTDRLIHLVDKGCVIAAGNRADVIHIWCLRVHVDVRHHEVQRRPDAQVSIQVCEVVLQVGVSGQCNLLL